MISEPGVTLTDYGLAIECAIFAGLLIAVDRPDSSLRRPLIVFFAMGAVASAAGGTWHGFFNGAGIASQLLWVVTLLALGISSLAAWFIGARLICPPKTQRYISQLAVGLAITYAIVVVWVTHSFLIAIVHYLPALVFLTGAVCAHACRVRSTGLVYGVIGLMLMFVAAGIQWSGEDWTLGGWVISHNTIYHLVQGIALALFFKTALWCVKTGQGTGASVLTSRPASVVELGVTRT